MILSSNLEDYLEVIVELAENCGHAHSADIAAKLKVKKPSVTSALRRLAQKGFVVYKPYAPIELTGEGKKLAEKIRMKHNIVKKFLTDFLEVKSVKANKVACEIEHAIDGEITDKLQNFMNFIVSSKILDQYKPLQEQD